jgi:integrase
MTETEVLGASQQRLIQWADFLGLRPVGKRQTYWVRKSARHPLSKRDFTLKASMRTPDLRTAIMRAQPVVQRFLAGVQTTLTPMVSTAPAEAMNLGRFFDLYLAWQNGKDATRARNVTQLKRIVQAMHPSVDPCAVAVDMIDSRLARQWLERERAAAAKEFLPKRRDDFERRKRGRNQILADAQSVFSRRAIQYYQDNGLIVPDGARAFAAELGLEARPAPPPEIFDEAELEQIRKGLPELKRTDPATHAALLLTLYAGLRNCEVLEARWSWIGKVCEHTFIDLSTQGTFEPKGRDGWVEIDAGLPELLRAPGAAPKPGDHIVQGATDYERWRTCYRKTNEWLKSCGVRKVNGKLTYRARGHAITQIYLAHGPAAAKEFARHSTQSTTDRYYMGAKVPYAPIKIA